MDASLLDCLDELRTRAARGLDWIEARRWLQDVLGWNAPETELKRAIARHGAFLMRDGDWTLHARAAAFPDRSVFVRVGDYELERGIFLPGGNLLPFLPHDLHPSEAIFSYRGIRLPRLRRELPASLLAERFAFFGEEEALVLIGIDDCEAAGPENQEASDTAARSRVFNAGAIYADPDFSPQRGLVMRMTGPGSFDLRPARPEDLPPKREEKKSFDALSAALARVYEFFGTEIGMDGQIAHAYWYAFGETGPPILPSFAAFMESPAAPFVARRGLDTILWPNPDRVDAAGAAEGEAHPDPRCREADLALAAAGLPLRVPEVEAMIRSLPKPDGARVLASLSAAFPDLPGFEGRAALLSRLEGLAAYVRERSDLFREKRVLPLRERALGRLLAALGDASRAERAAEGRADANPDFASVKQLIAELRSVIAFLNRPSPLGDERLAQLGKAVDEIGAALEILLGSLMERQENVAFVTGFGEALAATQKKAEAASEPRKKRDGAKREVAEADPGSYTLSLALAGLKPQVSRLVRVPGSTSLSLLSEIIQAAFSWSGRHLHCFRVADRVYGKRDANSLPSELDEAGTRLGSLGMEKGSRFEYEYDFGSSWIVIATVTGKAPPLKGEQPACLSGRGAAPPEDCGGPLAYSRRLGAWKGKSSPEYDRMRRRMGPDWDPGAFEPGAVDGALKALAERGNSE